MGPQAAADDPVADEALLPDREHLAELLEALSPEELRDLYRQFAVRARREAAILGRPAAAVDRRELEMVIHDLKGTAGNLALPALSHSAAEVLVVVRTQGVAEALAAAPPLAALVQRVTTLLESDQLDRLLAGP
jgi:HPt (histidine-containing phosphotransfer) domain-containing protein